MIISRWAWGGLRQTSPILLDANIDQRYQAQIEDVVDHQVSDIHIWVITADHYAAIISIVSHEPKEVEYFKTQLARFDKRSHITIEINKCKQVERTV